MIDKDKLMIVMRNVVNEIAPVDAYSLEDQHAVQRVKSTFSRLRSWLQDQQIDWANLSEQDLRTLGFRAWTEPDADGNVVMLAPLYLVSVIPDGTVLHDINGGTATVGKDELDDDARLGCISYGFKVKSDSKA